MAFPALTKTRSSRMNQPYAANAVQLDLAQSVLFSLIQNLLDTAAGGTLTGSRHANSVWTVRGSSDGVANVSLVGVNHIAARTNLVWAASGANHSWIWLENATLGYQVVIECVNATNTNVCIAAARTATPFTGGSLTLRPTSTEEFLWNSTSTGPVAISFLADTTVGATCYTHFITGDDGQFSFHATRAGTGVVYLTIALQKTTTSPDVRNTFWLGNAVTSGRGSCGASAIAGGSSGCVGRTPNGAAVVNTGGAAGHVGGGTLLTAGGTYTTDANTGKYNATPVAVWSANSGAVYAYRGMLPDIYTTTAAVGEPITSGGIVTRTVIGDYVWPCPGVAPIV